MSSSSSVGDSSSSSITRRCVVLCLGDVGRSPRMQYQAESITTKQTKRDDDADDASDVQWEVELVGYDGSECFPHILSNPFINIHRFTPASSLSLTSISSRFVRLALAPIKAITQTLQLLRLLLFQLRASSSPDVILVQNPPSIPTLIVALIGSYYHSCMFVIDWHNFGYSLLGINFGHASIIVKVARWYERVVGSMADGHLCVTAGMKDWLQNEWDIDALVLHDRAQPHFHRLTVDDAHRLFRSLINDQHLMDVLRADEWMRVDSARCPSSLSSLSDLESSIASSSATPFTYVDTENVAHWRVDRPTLIVSSTSWTADEDFTILSRTIQQYDREIAKSRGDDDDQEATKDDASVKQRKGAKSTKKASSSSSSSLTPLPRAVFLITGRGPMRDAFLASISLMSLRYCTVVTLFLAASDYPLLLGACDLGVSLHYSSSGLDLPMKVADMFGAGLPVCAVNFKCLSELVVDGVNGRVFGRIEDVDLSSSSSSSTSVVDPSIELCSQLVDLFTDFDPTVALSSSSSSSAHVTQLARLSAGARDWASVRWMEGWTRTCGGLISERALIEGKKMKEQQRLGLLLKLISIVLIVVGVYLMSSE